MNHYPKNGNMVVLVIKQKPPQKRGFFVSRTQCPRLCLREVYNEQRGQLRPPCRDVEPSFRFYIVIVYG